MTSGETAAPGAGRDAHGWTIRCARVGDLPALVALEQACFDGDRIAPRQMRYLLTRANATLLVATAGERLLGSAVLLFSRATALGRLYSIAVHPHARGRGLGRALLVAAEQATRQRGRTRVRLEVRRDNDAAAALYRSLGYHTIGELDDYYQDHMGAWRFERHIDEPDAVAPARD